ncbi:MAG: right-handed parallel beta-helix repeat-containing protein [Bacteroidales bacterium]
MKKWLLIGILIIAFANTHVLGQCDTIIPREVTIIDGNQMNLVPGNSICLQGGGRDFLLIKNIHGTAENPIVIKNYNGPVLIQTSGNYGVKISNCSYIQMTGSGNSGVNYGIQILKVDNDLGTGISVTDLSTNVEIDHMEIANIPIAGVYAKSDPDCNFNSTRDKFTMYNFWLHDCYLHDIVNEGLYIGSTKYSIGQHLTCDGKDTLLFPHLMVGTRIYNNVVENTGWDGIQVSSSSMDCEVYNNIVRNDSYMEETFQMSGIIIGGGSQCDCYNNQILDGKGDGFDIFGLGNMKIYNNLIVNAGRTYKPQDPLAFKHGIYVGQTVTSPNATFDFFNNTIVSPKSDGIKYSNNEAIKARFINNLITNPGRLAEEGNQAYINGTQPAIEKVTNYYAPDNAAVRFLNQSPDLYDLKPNSPAVNSGTNLFNEGIETDMLDRERPFHTYYDIGAYECHDPYASIDDKIKAETLIIFPNPTEANLNIITSFSNDDVLKINVLNLEGRLENILLPAHEVYQNKIVIQLRGFTKGTYILEVITKNTTFHRKFLVL